MPKNQPPAPPANEQEKAEAERLAAEKAEAERLAAEQAAAAAAKPPAKKLVSVVSAVGRLFHPFQAVDIDGPPVELEHDAWVQCQLEAGKLKLAD